MVEQESLQGQQYLASQQRTEAKLNSSVRENWLTTADITYLNELTGIPHINSIMDSSHLEEKTDISDNDVLCKIEMDNLPSTNFVAQDPNSVDVTYTDFYDSCDANAEMNIQSFDYTCDSPLSLWNSFVDLNNFKIDDVFQVDTADLFQGPTLAELNANDESLFDSLDSFESYLPSEDNTSNFHFQAANSSGLLAELDVENHQKEKIEDPHKYSTVIPVKEKKLHMKISPETTSDFCFGSTVTTSTSNSVNSDKANVPCVKSEDTMFQAVPIGIQDSKPVSLNSEICGVTVSDKRHANFSKSKKHFASTSRSWNECETVSSFCNDDEMDSQEDITDDEVFSSDDDSDATEQPSRKRVLDDDSSSSKKARYFWQYNIQAKGPKRPKMKSTFAHSDDVSSLVKVRRGDCNDLTPSPQKLYNIGIELQKLNSVISDLTPVNELPFNARPNSRKEKNKLASRACRLKKKAQHEANKLKFFGLRQEYDSLKQIMKESKQVLKTKLSNLDCSTPCGEQLEALLTSKDTIKVAGCSADFVNDVLKKVEAGDPKGGLSDL